LFLVPAHTYLCYEKLFFNKTLNMKKLFTLAFISILFIGQQASAQLKKGEKMLGGNIGFNDNKSEQKNQFGFGEQTGTTVTITPQLGFGLGNNWIVGISAGYTYTKQRSSSGIGSWSENRTTLVSGGVFARKSFPAGERFGFFGQADITYSDGKQKSKTNTGDNQEGDINIIEAFVSPGAYFRPNRRFIIEAQIGALGYSHTNIKAGTAKGEIDSFGLSLTDNLSLGFKIVL
jgi:hypothetical protein